MRVCRQIAISIFSLCYLDITSPNSIRLFFCAGLVLTIRCNFINFVLQIIPFIIPQICASFAFYMLLLYPIYSYFACIL
jgi:hypothetical protein